MLLQARLYELQKSPQTYCTEPDGLHSKFTEWRLEFNLDDKKGEISELLVSVDEMRAIYTKISELDSRVEEVNSDKEFTFKVTLAK